MHSKGSLTVLLLDTPVWYFILTSTKKQWEVHVKFCQKAFGCMYISIQSNALLITFPRTSHLVLLFFFSPPGHAYENQKLTDIVITDVGFEQQWHFIKQSFWPMCNCECGERWNSEIECSYIYDVSLLDLVASADWLFMHRPCRFWWNSFLDCNRKKRFASPETLIKFAKTEFLFSLRCSSTMTIGLPSKTSL